VPSTPAAARAVEAHADQARPGAQQQLPVQITISQVHVHNAEVGREVGVDAWCLLRATGGVSLRLSGDADAEMSVVDEQRERAKECAAFIGLGLVLAGSVALIVHVVLR
jgi:hypothetical protein